MCIRDSPTLDDVACRVLAAAAAKRTSLKCLPSLPKELRCGYNGVVFDGTSAPYRGVSEHTAFAAVAALSRACSLYDACLFLKPAWSRCASVVHLTGAAPDESGTPQDETRTNKYAKL